MVHAEFRGREIMAKGILIASMNIANAAED
jgi:hypothetical protein